MKKNYLCMFAACSLVLAAGPVIAQDDEPSTSPVMVMEMPDPDAVVTPPPEEPPQKSMEEITDEAYLKMVRESYDMPADFDFIKARELYTRTTFYSPYLTNPRKSFDDFMGRLQAKSSVVAKEAQAYMYQNFALPEAHSRAAVFFRKAGMPKAAIYHEWAAKGLVKAIRGAGNASTVDKAMKVVIISEEYLITESWGSIGEKRIEQVDGRIYDVMPVINSETGEQRDVWFDVTALHESRRRKLEADASGHQQ